MGYSFETAVRDLLYASTNRIVHTIAFITQIDLMTHCTMIGLFQKVSCNNQDRRRKMQFTVGILYPVNYMCVCVCVCVCVKTVFKVNSKANEGFFSVIYILSA